MNRPARERLAGALRDGSCTQAFGPILCLREKTGHLELQVHGSSRKLQADIPLLKIPGLGIVEDC